MAGERRSVKSIFDEAAEITSREGLETYLDRACGGDADLRSEVEALLRALGDAGDFLESSPDIDALDVAADTAPGDDPDGMRPTGEPGSASGATTASLHAPRPLMEGPGTMIGPYKLLQKIGEGGMGVVFMAEQQRPVRRKVALKVIKPGMDSGQVVARFEAERQALALMDHANIARVFDAGATDTGRPFFVMELVKGVPITEYCDRNQLPPGERLELFIPVCGAIQHAHQKGIIHRDIKPSNVLVTLQDGVPVPKVIDFGVAKAIDQHLTERTIFTEFGAVIGTLEYMSPEQAEMGSMDIDTRSDVYSLGVLLYELLTGSTPLERAKLRKVAFADVLKRIREEEPTRPSTRLSESNDLLPSISAQRKMEPARLTKLVRGELDWIVLKALEKDRMRRYETAAGFAKDIRRYIEGDPVEAGPPSASYKLGKFARKHQLALATAGAFAALLVVATAVSVGFAVLADRQKKKAEDREQLAIEAVKHYGDAIEANPELKNNPSLAGLRTALLKEPQAFFRHLRGRLQADRDTSPAALDRLAMTSYNLGHITAEVGDKPDAVLALEQAAAILEGLVRAFPEDAKYRADLGKTCVNLGLLKKELGGSSEAMDLFEKARDILDRLARERPSDSQVRIDLGMCLNNIGLVCHHTGRLAEAMAWYRRALEIRERVTRELPSDGRSWSVLAASYNNIGLVQVEMGRKAEALASYERARAILDRLAKGDPSAVDFQDGLARGHFNVGSMQAASGLSAEALASHEQARAIREKLVRENSAVTRFREDLAESHNSVAVLLREAGRADEAMRSFEEAAAAWAILAQRDASVADYQSGLARSLVNIGLLKQETGRQSEAMEPYERARAIREMLVRENSAVTQYQEDLAQTYNSLGILHAGMGEMARALGRFEDAVAIRERLASRDPSVSRLQKDLALGHHNLAHMHSLLGHAARAMESFRRAASAWEMVLKREPTDARARGSLASTYDGIGTLTIQADAPADATSWFEKAFKIREELAAEHPESPDIASDLGGSLNNLALMDLRQRHFDEARTGSSAPSNARRRRWRPSPATPPTGSSSPTT